MKAQVRIIGGRWRGRKLDVVDAAGLRPTPDRIRETLFNWLAPGIRNASVLDCFAGSGALGFEALSRGAGRLVAIEKNRQAASRLQQHTQRLDTDAAEIICGDACRVIDTLEPGFEIVFIDPPYAEPDLREQVFARLQTRELLNPGALIYFEWPQPEAFELPSPRLDWLRRKRAGQVNYALASWNPD